MNFTFMTYRNINNSKIMKHKAHILLSTILLLSLCSFTTNSDNQGKRKISNQLYSITLPSDWKPAQHIKGDGAIPEERTEGGKGLYHLSCIQWSSISENFYKRISIYIQGYKRKDGTPLSVNDIEKKDMTRHKELAKNAKRTDLKAKANQRRYMIVKKEPDLFGKYHHVRNFCLIEKSKGSVYLLNLALEEDVYQKPGVAKMINEILDSFVLKNK